jgi:hypothetical protein
LDLTPKEEQMRIPTKSEPNNRRTKLKNANEQGFNSFFLSQTSSYFQPLNHPSLIQTKPNQSKPISTPIIIMNALRPTILRTVARQQQQVVRAKTTTVAAATNHKGNPVPPQLRLNYKKENFKKSWLSDPSTYPIIFVVTGAGFMLVGMGINALTTYKDVQISPNKRGATMRAWGEEEHIGVTRRVVEALGGVRAEGLGIDHEKWAKQKKDYLEKK